ncbi:DUF2442 domain-containing protein [Sulfurospirillum sp. SCADC]|uniref:DUF2442 domain-containing protein n=1 Tax=Sulfurospirillum sp. SCADC TaxID=1537915 RepID=UPI00050154C6|nr:DUF2442 domain-containing protein [Sulfurospirillum sp. SCADC]KFL32958.1 hypothetical protein JU57_13800 [Sulfurospirillum sp. SCADC]
MSGLIKGKEVHFDDTYLHVKLSDERIISTPLDWYKPLKNATLSQLKNYTFICLGSGIEWVELDYQLSIESMLHVESRVA